jgi:hypothetical protein
MMYHVVYWTFDCRETRHAGDLTDLAQAYYDTEEQAYAAIDKIAEACGWITEEGGGFTVEANYRWLAEQALKPRVTVFINEDGEEDEYVWDPADEDF